jgi:hypothetical protein
MLSKVLNAALKAGAAASAEPLLEGGRGIITTTASQTKFSGADFRATTVALRQRVAPTEIFRQSANYAHFYGQLTIQERRWGP